MGILLKKAALSRIYDQETQPLPRFNKGDVICRKQQLSDTAYHAYLISRIQMIGSIPYYHLKGADGSYRIIPHNQIDQWRQTTEKEKQALVFQYSPVISHTFNSLFTSQKQTKG
jgi:hypothetical protein